MSKYMTFESQSFANGDLLLEALAELGFKSVTQGRGLPLDGWDKRNARTADIIVRRKDVQSHQLLADIGFEKTASGYVAVIDDMDLDYRLGKDFVVRLQNQYHEATARKMAGKLGGALFKERIGQTIKIRIKF